MTGFDCGLDGIYGFSAFLIEKGSVQVEIKAPRKHVSDSLDRGFFGLVRSFTSRLATRPETEASTPVLT